MRAAGSLACAPACETRPVSAVRAGDVPAGWPSIERPGQRRVRRWRTSILVVAAFVVAEVVFLAADFADRPWWAQAFGVAGVVALTATMLSAWHLAARPRRLFVGRDPSVRPVAGASRVVRRALLRGDPIDAASLREVALLAAAESRTPITLLPSGVVVGNAGLIAFQATGSMSRWLASAAVVVAVPVMVVTLVQSRRIRRAAAALGATPTVENERGSS